MPMFTASQVTFGATFAIAGTLAATLIFGLDGGFRTGSNPFGVTKNDASRDAIYETARGPDATSNPAAAPRQSALDFSDQDKAAIRDYFRLMALHRRCPPGLTRSSEGCLPRDPERRWQIGSPLPQDVVFHDLPPVLAALVAPPDGYRYVRVTSDVLIIAARTGTVVAAIEDIGRLRTARWQGAESMETR